MKKVLLHITIGFLLAIFFIFLCTRTAAGKNSDFFNKKGQRELKHYINGILNLYLLGDARLALMDFILAETYDEDSPEIKEAIAEAYLRIGNYNQSLVKAQEAISLGVPASRDGNLYRIAALAAAGMGKCKESAKYIAKAYIPNVDDYFPILMCFVESGQPRKAISLCKKLLKKSPESPELWTMLGKLYISCKKPDDAIKPLQYAISLDRNYAEAYVPLANAYIQSENFDKALEILSTYVRRFPNDRNVYEQYLDRVLVTEPLTDAKEIIDAFVSHFPDAIVEAWEKYASAAFVRQKYDEALETFLDLIEITEGTEASYYYFAGKCYEQLWCPESAAVMYRCGLEVSPSPDLWTDLAIVWAQQDEPESLLATLTDAAEEFPDSASLWFWGATALRKVNLWEMATHWLAEALRLEPEDIQTMFSLADTRERAGFRSESIALFERIIQKIPDEPLFQNYLGYILVDDSTRIEYGKELIKKAMLAEPDNAAYIDSYGWALFREGKPKQALKYLLRAKKLYADDAEIHLHLAYVYAALGDSSTAMDYAIRAIEIAPQFNKAIFLLQKLTGDDDEKSRESRQH